MFVKIGNPYITVDETYCRKYGGFFIHAGIFNINIYRNAAGELWLNNFRPLRGVI